MSVRRLWRFAPCGLAAASIAACSGGGGTSAPSASAPAIAEADAARFLTQSTMGVTDGDVTALQSQGYPAWISQQEGLAAATTAKSFLSARLSALQAANPKATVGPAEASEYFYTEATTSPDQLRQRVQLALSEIFVVSFQSGTQDGVGMGAYYDVLGANAFTNFRTLMEQVTLNPQMGHYLTYLANVKENLATGQEPDENYARELMQLMTIGLWKLNQDGSQQVDSSGNPIPTYTHDDISGLAKVFTGISYYSPTPTNTTFYGGNKDPAAETTPMIYYDAFHSISQKSFLGVTIPATTTANTAADVKTALDTIFNHPNVGPFVGRQLIQRLVTSNPSPAYVSRVAAVFNNDGTGVRGNMAAVVSAVLTDAEARTPPTAANAATYGKLREPILRMTNLLRSFGATSQSGVWQVGDTSAATSLSQSPLDSISVFNFWRPGYIPSNTKLGAANQVAPEFQVVNEVTVASYVNTIASTIVNGVGPKPTGSSLNDVQVPFTALAALSSTPTQLVAEINKLLFYDSMSSGLQTSLTNAVASIPIPSGSATAAQISAAQTARARLAVTMAMISPEYLVQR